MLHVCDGSSNTVEKLELHSNRRSEALAEHGWGEKAFGFDEGLGKHGTGAVG